MGDKGHRGKRELEAPPCSPSPVHSMTQIWGLDQLILKYPETSRESGLRPVQHSPYIPLWTQPES